MLLENYKTAGLLFNSNFLEATSTAGLWGYRGEWVLVGGEVGDAKGHMTPPKEVMRSAVLLADSKLKLVVGLLDKISQLSTFLEKYQPDFAADMRAVLYVVNVKEAVQVELHGINFTLIPLEQGIGWNEVIEELRLEKGDFKGMSAADKIVKVYEELGSYKPKYPRQTLEEVLANATNAVRPAMGPV